MTLTNGPNLGLLVNGNAGEAHHAELMRQWRGLDALVMPSVSGYLVNTPTVSPVDGYTVIIGAAPTGVWAGQGGKVARYSTVAVAWEFFAPKNGWIVQANTARETYRYTGSAWETSYQEATWTASLGSGWVNTGVPLITGKFTKNGRWIRCFLSIGGSSSGGTGTVSFSGVATITGLPAIPMALDGFAAGFVMNNNGGVQVASAFVAGNTLYFSGSGPANAYSYCTLFDYFI